MVEDGKSTTWGAWYWPLWLTVMLSTLLVPETWALFTNVNNTQSVWVWKELDVVPGKPWTALHFLMLGLWVWTGAWLTAHYFWRLFT